MPTGTSQAFHDPLLDDGNIVKDPRLKGLPDAPPTFDATRPTRRRQVEKKVFPHFPGGGHDGRRRSDTD